MQQLRMQLDCFLYLPQPLMESDFFPKPAFGGDASASRRPPPAIICPLTGQ